MALTNNMVSPAPRWYRITDRVIGNTENLVVAVWIILGHAADAKELLIYKLASSFIREQLRTFLTDGTVYAKTDENGDLQPVTKN